MARKQSVCLECSKQFVYDDKSSHGKFCGLGCMGEFNHKENIKEWLAGKRNRQMNRNILRKYLVETVGNFCSVCKIENWNSQPIVFEVDHIDGNASNDNRENLRLICPNCHSQTPTHSGRNRGKGRKSLGLKPYS